MSDTIPVEQIFEAIKGIGKIEKMLDDKDARIVELERDLAACRAELSGAKGVILQAQRELAEAKEHIASLEQLHCETVEEIEAQEGVLIKTETINAAWSSREDDGVHTPYIPAFMIGIIPCPRCGGTNRVSWPDPKPAPDAEAECDCRNNGWVIESERSKG